MGKILFFGGKGGVGKTSCSGAFAYAKASEGKRVLLVSTDPAHSTSDLFDVKIGDNIVKVKDNLYATEINPEKESEQYIASIKTALGKMYSSVIIDEINKQLDAARVSPGSHESALFDKMVLLINETSDDYDYIIFDTAPTGHTVRLLSLPTLLDSWINTLLNKRKKTLMYKAMSEKTQKETIKDPIIDILQRRKTNLEKVSKILLDSDKLGFYFVLNAEKLAIDETKKATSILGKYNIPIAGYIVNRILPENVRDDFWIHKKSIEAEHLKEIETSFIGSKIYKIPLLVSDINANQIENISEYFTKD